MKFKKEYIEFLETQAYFLVKYMGLFHPPKEVEKYKEKWKEIIDYLNKPTKVSAFWED